MIFERLPCAHVGSHSLGHLFLKTELSGNDSPQGKMLCMADQIVVVIGTLAGALLAYLLQALTSARQRRHDIVDRTRAERLQAAAALPTALVEYRHAQLARRMDELRTGSRSEPLSNGVRAARAEAWSALYRLELLVNDRPVRDAAYQLMAQIKDLKSVDDPTRLDEAGTEVHWGIQKFVELARTQLAFA